MQYLGRTSVALLAVAFPAVPTAAQQHEYKLLASDSAGLDWLGQTVAVSGDTIAAGAPADDPEGLVDAGSVYVWVRQGGVWVEQAKLLDGDAAPSDRFGTALALDGDTLMVGIPRDDFAGSSDQGSVTVFDRLADGTWLERQTLTASDAFVGDNFGASIALVGDLCLIGSPRDDDGIGSSGSVYEFTRSAGTWTQQGKIHATPLMGQREFGRSLALSPDGSRAVVGAWLENVGAVLDAGAAYVFARQGASWVQEARLTASDAGTADSFGVAVDIEGDVVVVGAYADDIQGRLDAGSAYAFVRSGGDWIEQAKLTAPDPSEEDLMGTAVAVRGDRVYVSIPQDDPPGETDVGSVAVFETTGWTPVEQLTGADTDSSDSFGWSVALDGPWTVVGATGVTAPGRGAGSIAAGAVFAIRDAWTDLGAALAGTQGSPQLEGLGDLSAGTFAGVSLTSARPSSLTFLVVGLSIIGVPFEGGVFIPSPDLILAAFTDGAGNLELGTTWPAGHPSDVLYVFQAWIVDPAGPFGYAASNGLAGVTP